MLAWLSFLVTVALLPPLFAGVVNRVKAVLACRRGAPLLQPFFETARLLRKGRVVGESTTLLFALGPSAALAGALVASCVAPLPGRLALFPFPGDPVLFAGALAFGRFLTILAALDTGSSFEGMGGSREALYGVFVEPSLLLCAAALSLASGSLTLLGMTGPYLAELHLAVSLGASIVLFILLLVEGSRVPVDDPNTHLELTMVHEVMALDHGGPDLAFTTWAAWLRMTLLAGTIACLLVPGGGGALALFGHAAFILLLAASVGLLESSIARFRLSHVPQFIVLSASFATILFCATLLARFGGGLR